MTFPSVHPLDNLSIQAMSPASSSTIRTSATVLFIILIITPFFLDRWLSRDTAVRETGIRETDAANAGRYGFLLTDATAEAGIDFVHAKPVLDPKLEPIMPHISALGASVSVVDFDNDGWQDLYATSSRKGTPNALYRNQGDGSFAEVAGEAGLADVNGDGGVSMGSVWGDYDNDGFEDVFIYMWGRQRLYRNLGDGTFEDATVVAGLDRWMNANSAVWTDVDRDGLIDLYVGGYFSEVHDLWQVTTTRIMQESFEYANNGGHNYLFLNRGNGRFEDVTEAYRADCTRWTMSVGAADLNGDGWPDLYLANDYGPEVLFFNIEGKRFEQPAGTTLEETSKSGMNVAFGDLYNDGRADVYVTNISKRGYLFQGNNLRRNLIAENGRMLNIAEGEIADAGWAWGAQFGDLNNDGFVDLFVTNGFVSADPEEDYWYEMSRVAMGNNNIFQDVKNWAPMGDQSLSGYERSRLYLNDGNGRFYDVAETVGVTDRYDGRGVAFADLFNRGVLDVVVANQDGPLVLYRNEVEQGNAWIAFELRGIRSNTSAIGAEVRVYWGGRQQLQVVTAGASFAAQSQRRRHFGLGAATEIERVEIRWPGGTVQTLERPEINRVHTVTEPEG